MIVEIPKILSENFRVNNNNRTHSDMVGHRTNLHKSRVFISTTNKHTEEGITGTLLFTTTSKKINYLGINLTKEIKDLCDGKF